MLPTPGSGAAVPPPRWGLSRACVNNTHPRLKTNVEWLLQPAPCHLSFRRRESVLHPRRSGPDTYTPEWTPSEASPVEEASAARPITPHHRAPPLRGQRRRVMRATLDLDSPGAGRFSVPSAVGRPTSHHGAAYGPRRRAHCDHPRLRGVQAAQLPDEQEQAQQPRSHHDAQVLQVVPIAHEPPGDPLAADDPSWRVTVSEPSSARRAALARTPARARRSRIAQTSPESSSTPRARRTSSTLRSSRAPAGDRPTRTSPLTRPRPTTTTASSRTTWSTP